MDKDLNGLILIGGKGTRMGEDKSAIQYHNRPQAQHLFDLLSTIVPSTYVSVRVGQTVTFTEQVIVDSLDVKGPLNGLLSAHEAFPLKAWLVLAVDLPFINESTIERLVDERDKTLFATSIVNENKIPEPLVAIWEPQALKKLKEYSLNGAEIYPRKFLTESSIKSIHPKDDTELFNVNDKMDYEKAKSIIDQKK